jgi:hypothetical protein
MVERTLLQRAGDVVFIICCVCLAGVAIANTFRRGSGEIPGARADVIPAGASYDEYKHQTASRTLVMYLHPSCRYCTQSMPLYRRLAKVAEAGRDRLHIRAIGNVEQPQLERYLAENGVQGVEARKQPPPPKVAGTPTLFVLDRDGRVLQSYAGMLSDDQEKALFELLRK